MKISEELTVGCRSDLVNGFSAKNVTLQTEKNEKQVNGPACD
jgi:hypothetical protein